MARFQLTQFSKAVLRLIAEDDSMSRPEKRRARFAIYFRPRLMRQAEEAALAAYVDEHSNAALGDGDFDWESALEFLRGLFEILLKFILGLGGI